MLSSLKKKLNSEKNLPIKAFLGRTDEKRKE